MTFVDAVKKSKDDNVLVVMLDTDDIPITSSLFFVDFMGNLMAFSPNSKNRPTPKSFTIAEILGDSWVVSR